MNIRWGVCSALSPVCLGVCGRTVSSWGPSPSRTSWWRRRQEDIRPAAPCGIPDPRAPSHHSPTATETRKHDKTVMKVTAKYLYSETERNAPSWDTAVGRRRRSPTEALHNSTRLTEWRTSAGTEQSKVRCEGELH